MKKILPILLIILISLNTFGFDFILGYLLFTCKLEVKEHSANNLIENEIKVFRMSQIDRSEFQKFDNEINYKGHMYDIIKEEEKNNDVYLYCFSDEKEDSLNKIVSERNNEHNNPNRLKYLQKDLTKNYLAPHKIENISSLNCDHIFYKKSSNYLSFFSDILSPPPNFLI